MGSHGGATAEGQRKLIEGFGVTEEFLGCEIRSSMETVIVAETSQGIPVHFDKNAYAADHLIVMGRIKPHTGFVGEIESGLHKMMLIGLGKHAGALMYHRAIKNYSFGEIIRSVAEVVLEKCKVLAGIAIVENAYDETALIEAIPPSQFYDREQELLKQAVAWMPKLPFPEADLLIHVATEKDNANIKRIFVRSLTKETKGNATGIGIAEFTLQSCVDQIDTESTRINCITSAHPTGAMIPCVYQNDRDAITDALKTIGLTEPEDAKVMHIKDTLHLAELEVSEAYLNDDDLSSYKLVEKAAELSFNSDGRIQDI